MSNSKATKIVPCPFCGHETVVEECDEMCGTVHGYAVYCKGCESHGPVVYSEYFAIVCWNRMGGE